MQCLHSNTQTKTRLWKAECAMIFYLRIFDIGKARDHSRAMLEDLALNVGVSLVCPPSPKNHYAVRIQEG